MFNREVVYEFSQEGLKQFLEDNKREKDLNDIYKVLVSSITTLFMIAMI